MSFEDEDIDALLRKRQMLDSLVMSYCVAGVEVPAELGQEFADVQNELLRREHSNSSEKKPTWTFWLGKQIGPYQIEYLIEEGIYWYLFHAKPIKASELDDDMFATAMIKVAKQTQYYGVDSGTVKFPTRLFAFLNDAVREVQPAHNVFIQAEIRRLTGTISSAIAVIEDEALADGCQYYRSPCFAGDTLRDLLMQAEGIVAPFSIVALFSQITSALEELYRDQNFVFHGNLKPENIVFTSLGVFFRELGCFEPMLCVDKSQAQVRVTTPQYYPWLDADDIGALGICLWEALIGYHPFDDKRAAEGVCIINDGLKALIDVELSLANIYVLPLLSIKRPHQLGVRTTEKLETILFKSLKLKVDEDGQIGEDSGYQSLAQFNADLLELLNDSQMIF